MKIEYNRIVTGTKEEETKRHGKAANGPAINGSYASARINSGIMVHDNELELTYCLDSKNTIRMLNHATRTVSTFFAIRKHAVVSMILVPKPHRTSDFYMILASRDIFHQHHLHVL